MEYRYFISGCLAILSGIMAQSLTDEVLDVIFMIMSILSIGVSLVLSIITWFKNATKDDYISVDEIKDLQELIDKQKEEINNLKEKDNGTKDDN